MASFAVVSDAELAYAFCHEYLRIGRTEQQKGLVQLRDGEPVAAVVYDDFNGWNVMMHIAARPGVKWLNRHFLHEGFKYPFVTLGAKRITGWVEANNSAARKFDEHLGFTREAKLVRAGSSGQDVIIYRMLREECRYA